jgi:hypothetical protein
VETWSVGALALGAVGLACSSGSQGGADGPLQVSATESITFATTPDNKVDLLFMLVNWSSTSEIKQKFYDQIPAFMNVLQSSPSPLDLHVAVVTPNMGAPGDVVSSLGGACVPPGDDGAFRYMPTGTCISTGLQNGATFLSSGNGVANFTGDMATTLQCIAMLQDTGCGFGQPLAAIDRALGADGSPAPATNAGFLRDDAYLAIVLLADQDDCSAPSNTPLFSLAVGGSNQQNIENALGPLSHYRCNQYGHLCKDPQGNTIMPTLDPPAGGTTLDLTDCTSNDTSSGLLTPVTQFVSDIKSLKPDPDNQIIVSGIIGPTTPYSVAWLPAQNGQNTQPGELWPEVEHSCGAAGGDDVNPEIGQTTTDGSQGDPGVRLAEFVNSFQNSALSSVCDPSYMPSMQAIATKVGALPSPPCLTRTIAQTAGGQPDCAVTAHFMTNGVVTHEAYENCAVTGGAAPCWSLKTGTGSCTGQTLDLTETTPSTNATVTCAICEPGVSAPGC